MTDNETRQKTNDHGRRAFLTTTAAGSTIALAGCLVGDNDDDGNGNDDGTDDGDTDDGDAAESEPEPAVLGSLQPFSGPFTAWGQAHQLGIDLAFEEANERDDHGYVFESVSGDTESSASEAATMATRFIEQDGVSALTGAGSSDVGIRIAQLAEDMEVPNLLHMSGAEEALPRGRETRYSFRTAWLPAPTHVRADLEFIQDEGYENVGFIVQDYAWGRAVEESVERFFPDDIEVTLAVAPFGESDFTPYLRNMPDEVELMNYVGSPAGAISAVNQQVEVGIEVPALGVDPPQNSVWGALGDASEFAISRHLIDIETPEFAELGERVAAAEDIPMYTYEANGYAVGQMFVDAVTTVGTDPVDIAEHFRTSSIDTLFASPVEYTEWGELDGPVMTYSSFEQGAPDYYPDGEFHLEPLSQTSPLEPFDPDEFET